MPVHLIPIGKAVYPVGGRILIGHTHGSHLRASTATERTLEKEGGAMFLAGAGTRGKGLYVAGKGGNSGTTILNAKRKYISL